MQKALNSVRKATACNAQRCSRGRPDSSEHYGLQAAGQVFMACHQRFRFEPLGTRLERTEDTGGAAASWSRPWVRSTATRLIWG